MNASRKSGEKDSGNRLPSYAIVLIILFLLAIMCRAVGIIYHIRTRKDRHADQNQNAAETNESANQQRSIVNTSGQEAGVYEDIEANSYEGLTIEIKHSADVKEKHKDIPYYANIPNALQKRNSPNYENTDFNQM